MLNKSISSYGFIFGNPDIWLWRKMREREIVWFMMDGTEIIIYVRRNCLLHLTVIAAIPYQARSKDTGKNSICPDVHSCKELSKPSCSLVVLFKIFQEATAKAYIDVSFDNCIISYRLMANAALHHLVTGFQWRGKQACMSRSSSGWVYPWSFPCRFFLLS